MVNLLSYPQLGDDGRCEGETFNYQELDTLTEMSIRLQDYENC